MLSKAQLDSILLKIPAKLYPNVSDEMLDHYASAIESKMIQGQSFEQALEALEQEFPKEDILYIQTQQQKIRRMKFLKRTSPLAAGLCLLAAFTLTQVQSHQPWRLPLSKEATTRMASGFGYRMHPIYKTKKLHTGMDFVAQRGTPVHPVLDGTVTKVRFQNKGYGNHIEVTHNDSTITKYAQLHEIKVKVGDVVKQNEVIATVGSSGTSTAPHLHFELIVAGEKIDPQPFLEAKHD